MPKQVQEQARLGAILRLYSYINHAGSPLHENELIYS